MNWVHSQLPKSISCQRPCRQINILSEFQMKLLNLPRKTDHASKRTTSPTHEVAPKGDSRWLRPCWKAIYQGGLAAVRP